MAVTDSDEGQNSNGNVFSTMYLKFHVLQFDNVGYECADLFFFYLSLVVELPDYPVPPTKVQPIQGTPVIDDACEY